MVEESEKIVFSKPLSKLNELHKEFISKYEQCPVLWDPKHIHYSNQVERSRAYDVLLETLRKIDPLATRECVKKQINSLRSNYRRLLRRHLSSKVLVDGEEIYRFIPTSWKFYAMRFLDSSLENSIFTKEEYCENDVSQDISQTEIMEEDAFETSNYETVTYEEAPTPQLFKIRSGKKRKSQFEFADPRYYNQEEYQAIGSNVAHKLRRMSEEQRHIAELLINKVLIHGLRNNLGDESDLTGLVAYNNSVM